ncbi:hypothetical protein [Cytobacillus stercorigallinarum]|nr:hypothetical protein [Cytobacillus stercorigallinarum]
MTNHVLLSEIRKKGEKEFSNLGMYFCIYHGICMNFQQQMYSSIAFALGL